MLLAKFAIKSDMSLKIAALEQIQQLEPTLSVDIVKNNAIFLKIANYKLQVIIIDKKRIRETTMDLQRRMCDRVRAGFTPVYPAGNQINRQKPDIRPVTVTCLLFRSISARHLLI